jgi:hypothetical protein
VLAFIVLFGLAFFWWFDLATLMLSVFTVAAGLLGALGPKLETSVWTQRQPFFHPTRPAGLLHIPVALAVGTLEPADAVPSTRWTMRSQVDQT